MKNIIYLIRHSTPFIPLNNYDHKPWVDFNRNMMLSVKGEKRAEKMSKYRELKKISKIYCTDSARAIATAKYIAFKNNLKLNIIEELAEINLGVDYMKEITIDFSSKQFKNENLKFPKGESISEVKLRMKKAIDKILMENHNNKVVIVLHGINLLSYLKLFSKVSLSKEGIANIIYQNKMIYNAKFKGNDIFKLTYINKSLVSIKNLK